ncbi:alpha/beta hydrolase [Polaromonas sp. P1(28)-13]|nr:alpha/beta hydrolase [Polaromonas sp. P1(28)-13]
MNFLEINGCGLEIRQIAGSIQLAPIVFLHEGLGSVSLWTQRGLDDEYGALRQLDEIALAAPQARQLRLADCGHSPQRDQPDKTVEAIADFLKNTR